LLRVNNLEKVKILIIEDEKQIARFLELELQHDSYDVKIEDDGINGVKSAIEYAPNLILLDIMLPGIDGIEACRRIREFSAVPVIMLTAMDETTDKVRGLDCGANDYITKPFEMEELLARIRAALRVGEQTVKASRILAVDELVMDLTKHRVRCGKISIGLTKREFDLLEYLMRNRGIVLSRDMILDNAWGIDYTGDTNVVDVYVKYLRDKLDASCDYKFIHTVRGYGYVLEGKNSET
jgi:two-component system response regulator ArlR